MVERDVPQNRRKTGVPGGESTRWKPGQSGNPGGRPKKTPLADACREVLALPVPDDAEGRTYAKAIAQSLAQKALAGDIRAAQELADRAEGKPRQSLEIENTSLREAFEQYAVSGVLPDWFPCPEGERNETVQ
jgi:hypothetical protein